MTSSAAAPKGRSRPPHRSRSSDGAASRASAVDHYRYDCDLVARCVRRSRSRMSRFLFLVSTFCDDFRDYALWGTIFKGTRTRFGQDGPT